MPDAHPIRRRLLLAGTAGAAATVVLPSTGRAASLVHPVIDSCADWNARPPARTIGVLRTNPNKIVIHHTVTANTDDLSRGQAHAHARRVQNLHMDGNGWSDTGYHFVVSRGGWITEGRHHSLATLTTGTGLVLGAHTAGGRQNFEAIAISNEGSYHAGATPPDLQWGSLTLLCAHVCARYGIPPTEIYGHRDFNSTQCPGVFHALLPRLRTEVATTLAEATTPRPLSTAPDTSPADDTPQRGTLVHRRPDEG